MWRRRAVESFADATAAGATAADSDDR